MSFQPVVPMGGYGGWAFLERTRDDQQANFDRNPTIQRNGDYFRANIGSVRSAEELIADRRLLEVSLGAFGLQDDINKSFLIRKVLEEGTRDRDALANRLNDGRYVELAAAFGFPDPDGPATQRAGFADRIVTAFGERGFEAAIGRQDPAMGRALGAQRTLPELAQEDVRETTKWYSILGQEPLRAVFETALGLPAEMGSMEIDAQLDRFRSAAQRAFGDDTIAQFEKPERLDALLQRYTVRAQLNSGPSITTPGGAALQLLQTGQGAAIGAGAGSAGILDLMR